MKVKYKKGNYVKDIFGRKKGKVDRINTDHHEPFYTLKGGGVFWESELEIDIESRDNRLEELLDNELD
ncbi:MAG: hypothetical protein SLAVMIC_00026 [uncultured marine phage]|uniref:Uncharacterized protein n=1 Tax=uncultured marine phage TaxID=707152 RepID=A0A8D9FRS8_9VIRU|nr:MAG: hypothetical protein SLAVMIC_00026 [uncultured marine phage]